MLTPTKLSDQLIIVLLISYRPAVTMFNYRAVLTPTHLAEKFGEQ